MSGLKQLRNRVKSIKSTQKITKAMQVVSAAKLKKLKEQAENLNDYSVVLGNIMYDITKSDNLLDLSPDDRKFFSPKLKEMPHLLIAVTSERGLCGGFNSAIIRKIRHDIEKIGSRSKEVKLLIIGKKGYDILRILYPNMIAGYYNIDKNHYECVALQVQEKIKSLVENEEVGACYLYYNKFKNAMVQIATKEQLLPAENSDEDDKSEVSKYEYEGDGLVHDVIGLYISGQINYSLLQSRASEEGARMTAMDNATRNAGDLIDKLTLKLNRSRQAIITTELIEIIAGAGAL